MKYARLYLLLVIVPLVIFLLPLILIIGPIAYVLIRQRTFRQELWMNKNANKVTVEFGKHHFKYMPTLPWSMTMNGRLKYESSRGTRINIRKIHLKANIGNDKIPWKHFKGFVQIIYNTVSDKTTVVVNSRFHKLFSFDCNGIMSYADIDEKITSFLDSNRTIKYTKYFSKQQLQELKNKEK